MLIHCSWQKTCVQLSIKFFLSWYLHKYMMSTIFLWIFFQFESSVRNFTRENSKKIMAIRIIPKLALISSYTGRWNIKRTFLKKRKNNVVQYYIFIRISLFPRESDVFYKQLVLKVDTLYRIRGILNQALLK